MQRRRFDHWVWEDPLEKEMAALSYILSWRIPWTEEPGGLQSMGWQRAGHNSGRERMVNRVTVTPGWI